MSYSKIQSGCLKCMQQGEMWDKQVLWCTQHQQAAQQFSKSLGNPRYQIMVCQNQTVNSILWLFFFFFKLFFHCLLCVITNMSFEKKNKQTATWPGQSQFYMRPYIPGNNTELTKGRRCTGLELLHRISLSVRYEKHTAKQEQRLSFMMWLHGARETICRHA